MSGHSRIWPDKAFFCLDIIRWPAVIWSPGQELVVGVRCYNFLFSTFCEKLASARRVIKGSQSTRNNTLILISEFLHTRRFNVRIDHGPVIAGHTKFESSSKRREAFREETCNQNIATGRKTPLTPGDSIVGKCCSCGIHANLHGQDLYSCDCHLCFCDCCAVLWGVSARKFLDSRNLNSFAPRNFAVLKLVELFSGHCLDIKC